ncbi:MAG: hypothetical protein ACTHKG_14690, partial [Nocardioides sp.]
HVGVAVIAVLGLISVAALGRLILRHWGWGVIAAAVLSSLPMWTGHSMFNVKDIPVATGYTMATLGLGLIVRRTPARYQSSGTWGSIALGAGAVLAVGTRPGIWPGIALSVIVALLFVALPGQSAGVTTGCLRERRQFLQIFVALLSAFVVLLLVYPNAFQHPLELLRGSASSSAKYRGGFGSPLYVPAHVLTEVPLVQLALAGVAVFAILSTAIRQGRCLSDRSTVGALLLLQAGALPLVAMLTHADLYNGLRQLLFAAPAVATLSAVGISRIRAWRWAGVAVGVVCVSMLATTVDQLRLFPYNYTYYNSLTDLTGIRPETDYWRTSVRELAPTIPEDGRVVCSPFEIDGRAVRYSFDGNADCATDPIGPLMPVNRLRKARAARSLDPTEFWAVVERRASVAKNCEEIASVTRKLRLRTLVMSYVARCQLDFPEYPRGGIYFGRPPMGWQYLPVGWSTRPFGRGVTASEGEATVAMTLPREMHNRSIRVQVGCASAGAFSVMVNGVKLASSKVEVTSYGLALSISRKLVQRSNQNRLMVGFRAEAGAPLDLRLVSLRLSVT